MHKSLGLLFMSVFSFGVCMVNGAKFWVGYQQKYVDHPFDKGRVVEGRPFVFLMSYHALMSVCFAWSAYFFMAWLIKVGIF